jgi:hypothetical protein
VFHALIGHLSPADYAVLHGTNLDEAVARLGQDEAALVVLDAGPGLADDLWRCRALLPRTDAVAAAVARIMILSSGPLELPPGEDRRDLLICSPDPDEVAGAVAQFFGERRRLPRADADLRVEIARDSSRVSGRVKNVSARTVRVESEVPLSPGERVQLHFTTQKGELTLEAEVIATSHAHAQGAVLQFLTESGKGWERYQRAVDRMLRRQHNDSGTIPSVLIYDTTDAQVYDVSWMTPADEAGSMASPGHLVLEPPTYPATAVPLEHTTLARPGPERDLPEAPPLRRPSGGHLVSNLGAPSLRSLAPLPGPAPAPAPLPVAAAAVLKQETPERRPPWLLIGIGASLLLLALTLVLLLR